MKKVYAVLMAFVMLIIPSVVSYAEEEKTVESFDVYAKYDGVTRWKKANIKDGKAEIIFEDGYNVSVSKVPDNAKNLIIYPVPSSDTEALGWMESEIDSDYRIIKAFDIYLEDKDGNRVSSKGINIAISNCRDTNTIYLLNEKGDCVHTDTAFADGTISFTSNGNRYCITAKMRPFEELSKKLKLEYIDSKDPLGNTLENKEITYTLHKNEAGKYVYELPVSEIEGYELNWYTDSDCRSRIDKINEETFGNITVYGRYEGKTYNIVYDLGDTEKIYTAESLDSEIIVFTGTSSVVESQLDSIEFELGKPTVLAKEKPVREGYDFLGWYNPENGESYKSAATITIENRNVLNGNNDLVLNAVWKIKEFAVKFTSIKGATASEKLNATQTEILKDNGFTVRTIEKGAEISEKIFFDNGVNTGYKLVLSGEEVTYNNGIYIINPGTESTEVVAQIKPQEYTLTLNAYSRDGKIYTTEGSLKDVNYNTEDTSLSAEEPVIIQELLYNTSTKLFANTMVLPGYTFMGWTDGEMNTYANKASVLVDQLATVDEENHTAELYAVWKQNSYKISYKGLTSAQIKAAALPTTFRTNDDIDLAEIEEKISAAIDGYALEGLYIDKNYETELTAEEFREGKALTVCVKVEALTYTISLDGNGAEFIYDGETDIEAIFNKKAAIPKAAVLFGKEVYINGEKASFAGWTTEAGGKFGQCNIDYKDGTRFTKQTEGEDITLYAVWKYRPKKITYKGLNAAQIKLFGLPTTYQGDTDDIYLPTDSEIEAMGYQWVANKAGKCGWYTDSKYTDELAGRSAVTIAGEPAEGIQNSKGNITVYAVGLTAQSYKVEFIVGEDVTGKIADLKVTFGKNASLKKVSLKKTGYTLAGWSTVEDGELEYINGAKLDMNDSDLWTNLPDNTLTLYPVWTPVEYKITWKNLTKTQIEALGLPLTINSEEEISLPGKSIMDVYPKYGYEFDGWYTSGKFIDDNRITSLDGVTKNITVYASFVPQTFRIDYIGCDGAENPNPDAYTYSTKAIKLKNPVKPGYIFKGWYIEVNKVTSIKTNTLEDYTLAAKWQENKYKVSFDANGGKLASFTRGFNMYTSESQEINVPQPTRKGYIFDGWTLVKNGDGTVYGSDKGNEKILQGVDLAKANPKAKNNAKVKLYAKWIKVSRNPKVTFEKATEEFLSNPDNYILRDWNPIGPGENIIMVPEIGVTNISVYTCFANGESNGKVILEATKNYSIENPDKPVVVKKINYGDGPTFAVVTRDIYGKEKQYLLTNHGNTGELVVMEVTSKSMFKLKFI